MKKLDHPIFLQSIRLIKSRLGATGLDQLQQQVLERLIHSSGDFGLQALLRFSPSACQAGLLALKEGSIILTDTSMAAAAISPMAMRTLNSSVRNIFEWAPDEVAEDTTRAAVGIEKAWTYLSDQIEKTPPPLVVIGSAPTALDALLELVSREEASPPSLIIGMPVGFIGVSESKSRLYESKLPYISLEGTRGGAGLAASVVNALLRASVSF